LRLAEQVDQLIQASSEQDATTVKVIWSGPYYWPLPWYLRKLDNVQWWTGMPAEPAAPIVLALPRYDAELTRELGDDYIMTGYFQLRPQVLVQLWVQFDLWEAHLKRLGRL
jgi:predicted membrane-bound mannosyltransferase